MTRSLFHVLLLAALLSAIPGASAVEIEGVKIDDKVVLLKGGPDLVLNGAGVRHKLVFIKVYVGGLYLTKKISDRDAILADTGPKRISMHVLSNEVTASDLITSMNNALAANLVPHELALIEKRISSLNSMMASVKAINRGSTVYLDYIPEIGTRVTINGQEKLTIPGEDFYRAMMHIWIGNQPVDGRLRDAMLGKASRLF
jgi:Chalcone isomerase-like